MSTKPKISVVTANKNGGRFLRETIESVLMQHFTDYEHIVVDGASTDNSVAILKEFAHIRWISEPDRSPEEGFYKAFKMARGDYVMVTCASDGYLSRTWFQRCVEILNSEPDVSIVWGLALVMNEAGDLAAVWNPFAGSSPPQKQAFFPYWLKTGFTYPELNYCVRRDVFSRTFPPPGTGDEFSRKNPFVSSFFNLNAEGYLPYFLPIYAHFGRIHDNQHGSAARERLDPTTGMYFGKIKAYLEDLASGRKVHAFRNGKAEKIGEYSREDAMLLLNELHPSPGELPMLAESISAQPIDARCAHARLC